MSRELLRQVIAECSDDERIWSISSDLYCAILEYLEIPEPEPVAWIDRLNFELLPDPNWRITCYVSNKLNNKMNVPLYAEPADQSARIAELKAALQLAKDMMIANDLSLPRTFEVIDEALAKSKEEL